MSYEDTLDLYKDRKAIEQLERQQRFAARTPEIETVRKAGYRISEFNNGYLVQIESLDYWPSTGKWRNSIKHRRGTLQDGEVLIELVKTEVGPPPKDRYRQQGRAGGQQ